MEEISKQQDFLKLLLERYMYWNLSDNTKEIPDFEYRSSVRILL